jgi:hypothetical protein
MSPLTLTSLAGLRWQAGKSRALRAFAYSAKTRTLFVEFNGKREDRFYAYYGVSPYRARKMREAESRGGYFTRRIKNRYDCARFELTTVVPRWPE